MHKVVKFDVISFAIYYLLICKNIFKEYFDTLYISVCSASALNLKLREVYSHLEHKSTSTDELYSKNCYNCGYSHSYFRKSVLQDIERFIVHNDLVQKSHTWAGVQEARIVFFSILSLEMQPENFSVKFTLLF